MGWGEQSPWGSMEKSGYAMAKFGLETKEAMPRRDCGFYMKYVFLFTSLIQFLIILGLVLFMVYGNAHAGTDTHLRLLEGQMQDRYNKIITLSGRNANLTRALNNTLKEKQGLQGALQKVQRELDKCNSSQLPNATPKVRAGMGRLGGKKKTFNPPPRDGGGGVGCGQALLVMMCPHPQALGAPINGVSTSWVSPRGHRC